MYAISHVSRTTRKRNKCWVLGMGMVLTTIFRFVNSLLKLRIHIFLTYFPKVGAKSRIIFTFPSLARRSIFDNWFFALVHPSLA
jgi:hypothetical protein